MPDSAMKVRLNVKPLMGFLKHTAFWEGPCRGGAREDMTPEAENARCDMLFEKYCKSLEDMPAEINILEPLAVPYYENFMLTEEQEAEIRRELADVDYIMVMNQRIPKIERFKKPIISYTHTVSAADTCAYLRSIGMEAYYPIDRGELVDLLHLLWVRKAVANTRALILTAGEQPTWGLLSNIRDLEGVRRRFGFEVIKKPFTDIFPVMDDIDPDAALALAEKLYNGAHESRVRLEWLSSDLRYYLASQAMMDKYRCNAFSTACVELCRSRIPQNRKFVPCIAHSLNKDSGIPSACEEDMNAMLAMTILMYTAQRPAFMGNPLYESDELMSIHHSVPCLKMNGFDKPSLDYSIYSFTGQGFGGKIQIDFAQNAEDEVTLARFDPTGTRMLVKTGKVLRTEYRDYYCSPFYYLQMDDVRGYLHKMMDFGHHQALVFGNQIEKLRQLSQMMGFTLVEG